MHIYVVYVKHIIKVMISILFFFSLCQGLKYSLNTLPTRPAALNISYYSSVTIENKTFNLGIDFYSVNTFIFSSNCSCTNGSNFLPGIPLDLSFLEIHNSDSKTINYKNYTLSGFHSAYSLKNDTSTIPINLFIVETSSSFLTNFTLDGILGLGHGSNLSDETFTENIISDSSKNFALVLTSPYNSSINSFIEFGQDDIKSFFHGKQRVKDVKEDRENWELYTNRFGINDHWVSFESFGKFDINSKEIMVPHKHYEEFLYVLDSVFYDLTADLDFPCSNEEIDEFKPAVFKIQRTKFPLRPRNFIEYKDGRCQLLFKETPESKWVFGEPFFKDYFIRFNYENNEVTFYQLDIFMPGFYEVSILVFAVSVFFISLCGGWCLTRRNPKEDKEFLLDKQTN